MVKSLLNKKSTITICGNCQVSTIRRFLGKLYKHASINKIRLKNLNKNIEAEYGEMIKSSDLVLIQDSANTKILQKYVTTVAKVKLVVFPTIVFKGFHPDCIYLNKAKIKSPIGDYHSSIILISYLSGLKEKDCEKLFNNDIYNKLGFDKKFKSAVAGLQSKLEEFGHKEGLVEQWLKEGVFMHTPNHPTAFLIRDIVKQISLKSDIKTKVNVEDISISDPLKSGPIYPVLQEKLRQDNSTNIQFENGSTKYSLEEFIKLSYEIYDKYQNNVFRSPSLNDKLIQETSKIFTSYLKENSAVSNPYRYNPNYTFWKKSISSIPYQKVDPVVGSKIKLNSNDKLATAGSCFAQHIASRLSKSGYNYYVSEQAPNELNPQQARKSNYGVYTARYGNIYTTEQLFQLFQRAFGQKDSISEEWKYKGRYVDPYRPAIEPDGFETNEDMIKSRNKHLESVKEMFLKLDYFIFTLGLTESWVHKETNSVLPVAPGVNGGKYDTNIYGFKNFNFSETKSSLQTFITELRKVNKTCKVILTVSPVSLLATYEDRHVLVSTIASKSILRSVVEEVKDEDDNIFYFPSYEIITGSFNKGLYYEKDARSVKEVGVNHVMRLFMKHCTSKENNLNEQEMAGLEQIICDEELIENND